MLREVTPGDQPATAKMTSGYVRVFSRAGTLPSCAFSILFLVQKTAACLGEFLEWLLPARLATTFFAGARRP